jgi:uncharacterized membrane protein
MFRAVTATDDNRPMPFARRGAPYTVALTGICLAAAALRFVRLGAKPLWLDEAMTVLVSAGRGPADVPIGRVLPVAATPGLLSFNQAASLTTVIERLRDPLVQHIHPPAFYVLLRLWFALTRAQTPQFALLARGLAAAFGVAAVLIVVAIAREVTTRRGALIAAALTAVSPLMVMISREARNYTLPLVCVAAATWACVRIVDALEARRPPPARDWAVFAVASLVGCYAHYFVLIAFGAHVAVLAWFAARLGAWRSLAAVAVCAAAIGLAFAPWVSTLARHVRSPEQAWMRQANPLMYVFHTLSAWQAMIQGWKFDSYAPQRLWKAIRIAIGLVVLVYLAGRVAAVLRDPRTPAALRALAATCAIVIAALWIAAAIEQKDLLSEYRYHFVYYPALIVLIAAALHRARVAAIAALVALGAAHSVFLVAGWEFPQLTRPSEVAAVLVDGSQPPALVAVGEASFHETINALTFLLAFNDRSTAAPSTDAVFVRRSDTYPTFEWGDADPQTFWSRFGDVAVERAPQTAWIWASSMLPADYRSSFRIVARDRTVTCTIDPREAHRTPDDDDPPRGPFRRYRCL